MFAALDAFRAELDSRDVGTTAPEGGSGDGFGVGQSDEKEVRLWPEKKLYRFCLFNGLIFVKYVNGCVMPSTLFLGVRLAAGAFGAVASRRGKDDAAVHVRT